jgi:nucleoside-diphosphate-sugar epimerase
VSRILVTGASGFIGRAVVAGLAAAGHEVRAAVRRTPVPALAPPVELARHGDLDLPVDWRPLVAGMDAVIHLAGVAHAGPGIAAAHYDRVNHLATAALADAAHAAGVQRLIFMSSIRAQSGPASDRVLTEALEPQPTDAYGRSKLAAEAALHRSGTPFTILRPVLVYGAGMTGNLRALMRLAALPIPLPFGAFANRRSLVSVQNLLAAIAHALQNEASRGQTYVVADPHALTLARIVTALRLGIGRAGGLIAVPPDLIRLGLAALGRRHDWDRLNGPLIVDPAKLIAAGWRPDPDTAGALAATAREWRIAPTVAV